MEGGDLRVSAVDNRVVKMSFDNAQFESGVKATLSSLDSLNKSLKLQGATKGLEDLSSAGDKVQLGHIATAAEDIASKFKALSIIGITALTNIAMKAIDAGSALLKSFTVQPIIDGLHEYETNLNSIQTIMANTGLTGQEGLGKVNAALNELNKFSDETIFNFSEMARNIGTFTAAGVTLDVATSAIKGIANLAAISGSSADQASTAMYQLSQAISAGKVSLEDWNSVVNAGMGGKVFQNALMETARIHGVAIDQMVKDEGSFRMTLQNGWLTGQILTETLSKFTGDLTAAQLKTMGYNDKQIAGILEMGRTAKDAATKIKTLSQLVNTLQEAAGSGWTQTWQLIFGDFDEAKTMFTDVNNVLSGYINASANARNKVLGDWKAMGGRTAIINAIENAFHALIAVVTPLKDAFREIFPPTTGAQLDHLSVALENFTAGLIIGANTAENLKRTFAGVFAIFDIGFTIIGKIAHVLIDLFTSASAGGSSFLGITANVGDFLVALDKAIKSGTGLTHFFQDIEKILAVPIKLLQMAASAVGSLFDKFDGNDAEKKISGLASKIEPFGHIADAIINVWSQVPNAVSRAWELMAPIAAKFGSFFAGLGHLIATAFDGINFDTLFKGIATGGFTALLLAITSFIKKLKSGVDTGGIIEAITAPFDELTNTLKTMQNTLKAATLLEIAAAIALLTISVIGLSKVDADGLTKALTAIGVMFAQLVLTLGLFTKVAGKGSAKLILVGASLILLATAVDILTVAVKNLSQLSWQELAKGLTGLAGILTALIVTTQLLPDNARLIAAGTGLLILSAAIKVLVSAVTDLSGLSWQEIGKGLVGVGSLLASLALFTKFAEADKAGIIQGAGIVLLAVGVKILASALSDLGNLSWSEIGKGLTAMAGGLTLMAAALILIPPSSLFSAAAILVVATSLGLIGDALNGMGQMSWGSIGKGLTVLAGALTLIAAALILIPPTSLLSAAAVLIVAGTLSTIADALAQMAKMSWTEIGKSLVELAGALGIITGTMTAMVLALPGAAALLVVAASLAILAPVLELFGNMSWEEMGKGLLMLAGVFVVLGVAGLVLTPVVPTLIALGIAVTLLGVGMLAAGAGLLAFSVALTALSISGVAGAAALVGIVAAIAGLFPEVMRQVALGLVAFAQVIGTAGPAIVQAITTVLGALMDAINATSPKIIATMFKLLTLLLETLVKYEPHLVDEGYKLIIGLLDGIARNIGGVVTAATSVVVAFINGVSANQGRIIQAGVNFIINYINGLASAIRSNSGAMGDAGANLATAIVEGMIRGLASGAGRIASEARHVAQSALDAALHLLGIKSPSKAFEEIGKFSALGMAVGLEKYASAAADSAVVLGNAALDSLKTSLSDMSGLINTSVETAPVITPVLDLSEIKKNADRVGAILQTKPISVNAALVSATDASTGLQNNRDATNTDTTPATSPVTYNQYNNSPKSLSAAQIYRQTKNQLSVTKGAVTANAN
jgi:tape measure domain-containing protein